MMRFGPNSWARKVWYRKRKTQKCHLRFCGTVNKKGHSFRKGGALQVVKTEIRLWYFCGQTRNRRGKNHGDFHFGGPDRIRTDDPYNANVVRSQLRHRPLLAIFSIKKVAKNGFLRYSILREKSEKPNEKLEGRIRQVMEVHMNANVVRSQLRYRPVFAFLNNSFCALLYNSTNL